jgi:hypothetical protein
MSTAPQLNIVRAMVTTTAVGFAVVELEPMAFGAAATGPVHKGTLT